MTRALLLNSEELTDEEEILRVELLQWARQKRLSGNRPVPIGAALKCAGEDWLRAAK